MEDNYNQKSIEFVKNATHSQLENMKIPEFDSIEELNDFVNALTDRPHTVNSKIHAIVLASVATYKYMTNIFGSDAFQINAANLDIYSQISDVKSPFDLILAVDMLYPTSDIRTQVDNKYDEWLPWAANEAQSLIDQYGSKMDSDSKLLEHWKKLAKFNIWEDTNPSKKSKKTHNLESEVDNGFYDYCDAPDEIPSIDEETEYIDTIINHPEERGDL